MTPSLSQFLEFGFTEEVVVLSKDLRIVTANIRFLKNNSYHLDSVTGEYCHNILNGCRESCLNGISDCPLQEALATGNKVGKSHVDVPFGDHKKHLKIEIYPIPPEWHDEQFFLHITSDITEQMELERLKEEMWERILKHMEQLYSAMITSNQDIETKNREVDFLSETMPLSLVGWDKDGSIIKWNASAEILFGWKQEEMIGRPFEDVFSSGKSLKSFINVKNDILKGRTLGYSLAENRTSSGRLVHCEWYHSAQYAELSTEISGGLSMGQDVTDKVLLEEKASKTSDTLTTILGSTGEAIVGIDSFGRINLWNHAAERIFGWPTKEIFGKEVELLLPLKSREAHRHTIRNYFSSATKPTLNQKIFETTAITRNNEPFPVKISISSTTIAGKLNVLASIRDVSDEINLLETIKKHKDLRELGELAFGITQRIKSYLTVIDSNLQMIKECRNLSEAEKLLSDVDQAIKSGVEVVNSIYSKKNEDEILVDEGFLLTDPNSIISEVILLTSFRWKEQAEKDGYNIDIKTDLYNEPIAIPLRVKEFRSIVSNILFNAIDALQTGGKIFLSTTIDENQYIFRCEDNGKGISPSHIDKIFQPFFSTKDSGRSGLGLSATRESVERHGGTISVKSHLEAGAAFIVSLPLTKDTKSTPALLPEECCNLNILIVESDTKLLKVLERIFSTAKHNTVTEKDGKDGIRTFQKNKFDLVVCGLAINTMGSKEFSTRLKRHSPHIPILLITGWNDYLDKNILKRSGIDDVIIKPFNNQNLVKIAERLYLSKKSQQKK